MAAIVGALLVYLIYHYFNPLKPPSNTIGTTKVVDGIEYWNMGDLDDQDNWVYVGPSEFQYFINVYIANGELTYSLSNIEDVSANHRHYFYDLSSAEEKLKLLKSR